MTKKQRYIKKYRDYTKVQLNNEKVELERNIKNCEEYIKSAYNTFLGPLGATATIKDCCIRLEIIKEYLRKIDNQKTENINK